MEVGDIVRPHKSNEAWGQYVKVLAIVGDMICVVRLLDGDVSWAHKKDLQAIGIGKVEEPEDLDLQPGDLLVDSDDEFHEVLARVNDVVLLSQSTGVAKDKRKVVAAVEKLVEGLGGEVNIFGLREGSKSSVARRTPEDWFSLDLLKWRGLRVMKG